MRNEHSRALEEAIALAGIGLPCFPCASDKRPTTVHGYKDARRHPLQLEELWKQHPGPLVGVPTGAISHFDVVDLDKRNGAEEWLHSCRSRLPQTRVHRTRSGGLHIFFEHHNGLRCSASKIAPGVDVRADGGYVIWWPAAGLPILCRSEMTTWPSWLLRQTEPPSPPATPRSVVPDDARLLRIVRSVATAPEGQRNHMAFWGACRAGEMVASGHLSASYAASVIAEAATRAGLSPSEAMRTANSGIRKTGGHAHG